MQYSFRKDDNQVLRATILEQLPWLEHGFATSHTTSWPDWPRLAMLKQVHSAKVVAAPRGATGYIGEGDALITNEAGLLAGVRTADCVPILLADSRNRAVAAIHAGWRGTAGKIVMAAISELRTRFRTDPSDLYAAIGPAIGPCCYEVGPEVARVFGEWWPDLGDAAGRVKLDLALTNQLQLEACGVSSKRIASGAPCTFCTVDAFHSYRRDRERAGRMISAIGIRERE